MGFVCLVPPCAEDEGFPLDWVAEGADVPGKLAYICVASERQAPRQPLLIRFSRCAQTLEWPRWHMRVQQLLGLRQSSNHGSGEATLDRLLGEAWPVVLAYPIGQGADINKPEKTSSPVTNDEVLSQVAQFIKQRETPRVRASYRRALSPRPQGVRV
ncbi:MAG TPA: hypothetical protein VH393_10350 [Ktedonobacterales bacterium]